MGNNVDTARGMYEAFAKGDVEEVLGAMDPNVDWVCRPWGPGVTSPKSRPVGSRSRRLMSRVLVPS